jgi:hypothetical protein
LSHDIFTFGNKGTRHTLSMNIKLRIWFQLLFLIHPPIDKFICMFGL